MDAETSFLKSLIELQYGQDVTKKLTSLAKNIPWAHGYPQDKTAFWNAEAFMWSKKIDKETRTLITNYLKSLEQGKNCDLGCGAYSYISSVGVDLSRKMLDFNDNCTKKFQADLETPLSLKNEEFDSVTAIFLLNYIQNQIPLLQEISRILKKQGTFIAILSAQNINPWQRQKQVNDLTHQQWLTILSKHFTTTFEEKKKLWIFRCKKST
jgi:SAM-dependent methyltransferase